MARAYFRLFYDQYLPLIAELSDAERGRLFMAVLTYARDDYDPGLTGNERYVWPLIREDIDRDKLAYLRTCLENSKKGKKGALKKQENRAGDTDRPGEDAEYTVEDTGTPVPEQAAAETLSQAKQAEQAKQATEAKQANQANQTTKSPNHNSAKANDSSRPRQESASCEQREKRVWDTSELSLEQWHEYRKCQVLGIPYTPK